MSATGELIKFDVGPEIGKSDGHDRFAAATIFCAFDLIMMEVNRRTCYEA